MNRSNEMVSVVIPTYNAENFIEETVKSVYGQIYRPLEVIIVNDGSTDSTPDRIDEIISATPDGITTRVIDMKVNGGAAKALRTGFSDAKGAYICWLSADDVFVDSHKIELQIAHMLKSGSWLSYYRDFFMGPVPSDARKIETAYLMVKGSRALDGLFNSKPLLRALMLIFRNPINGSSVMIKKECIERYGRFDPDLMNIDADGDLWMRYSLLGMKFEALSGSPLFYRVHSQQTSQSLLKMNYGIELTRMRILTYLSEERRLDSMLRSFAPFLPLILARKYHLHAPLSSSFIGEYILDRKYKCNYLIKKAAERMLSDARCRLEGNTIDSTKLKDSLKRISDNAEFKSFKSLMIKKES